MLDLLNRILLAPIPTSEDRILWRDLHHIADTTIGQLRNEVAVLRHRLARHDAKRWLLYSENPRHFLPGFLALLSLDREVVISASNKPEWLSTLRDGFDAILADDILFVGYSAGQKNMTEALGFPYSGAAAHCQTALTGNEQIVFFTSGSTGQPKAIRKPLCALTNEIDTLLSVFSQQLTGAVFAASVSHLHIYGLLFRLLLPLAVKGSAVMQQIEFQEQLLKLEQRFEKTAFISSPAFLARLDATLPVVALDAVFSSGGPLPYSAARASMAQLSQCPVEVYGSTETGGIGYRQQVQEQELWTLFPRMRLTATDQGSELQSPHMPDVTCYLLDDNVELLPDGRFMLKGRKDRIVKISEKRVSLTEMENFVGHLDGIAQCVVLPFVEKRESVACAVVLNERGHQLLASKGRRQLIDTWKTAMRARFDNVVIPRKWQLLNAIPLNSQSKIDTARLMEGFMRNNNDGHA